MVQTELVTESAYSFSPLPRGGVLVEAPDLRLQIGSYPETIKDTLLSSQGVPDLYLVPDDLFDVEAGVSASDLEFPLYYNFFLKGRRCRFLCHARQVRPLMRVLKEAVFGPSSLRLEAEFPEGSQTPGFPDLAREMAYYKRDPGRAEGRLRLKHMLELLVYDDQNQHRLGETTITSLGGNRYRLEGFGESHLCQLPACPAALALGESQAPTREMVPPRFGLTMIGNGHGFDAQARTSGFILWLDGRGVLVDPPVHTTQWMRQEGIDTRLIDDLILTHCHADHDSGTLQKVLEEGRVRLHTTETVRQSFVAKYSALTGLSRKALNSLFEFCPVLLGRPITLAGGKFRFHYTLHSIPTLGFQVEFGGASLFYSCDTLYDPDRMKAMAHEGVLSEERLDALLNVPWDSTVILHEAGIPPLHTPIEVLSQLPETIKKRLLLTHVSANAIPADSGLRLAQPGAEATLSIPCQPTEKGLACKILDVLRHVDLFAELSLQRAEECVAMTELRRYAPGQTVITKGTYGDAFFMVASGEVEVLHEGLPQRTVIGRYDYLGETAVITGQPRNADIVARTETELLCISKEDFLRLVRGSSIPNTFQRLAANRAQGARWLFEKHRSLATLSPMQRNQLLCRMHRTFIPQGQQLFRAGDPVERTFLIDSGQVQLIGESHSPIVGPGCLVGELGDGLEDGVHRFGAQAHTDLWAYSIGASEMAAFFQCNPGTLVRAARWQKECLTAQGASPGEARPQERLDRRRDRAC